MSTPTAPTFANGEPQPNQQEPIEGVAPVSQDPDYLTEVDVDAIDADTAALDDEAR